MSVQSRLINYKPLVFMFSANYAGNYFTSLFVKGSKHQASLE